MHVANFIIKSRRILLIYKFVNQAKIEKKLEVRK
jgi:hypothetical protein